MPVPAPAVQVQGQGVIGADQANTYLQGAASVAQLRTVVGLNGMTVWLQGTTLPNDGGQNMYWWNSASTAADNGGSVIKPTAVTGNGAWLAFTDAATDILTVTQFGADPTGLTDSTVAINAGITAAVAQGQILFVPAGTYIITPATPMQGANATVCTIAFPLQSNLQIQGEAGAIFKIANGVSTDLAPKFMAMFGTNQALSNITIRDLVMDMNGANNTISPGRPGVYAQFNQAQIYVSGPVNGSSTTQASLTNVLLENCQFINSPGVSCIVMGQTNNGGGTALGKTWRINKCVFSNNGTDTNDHSSVYGWADDVVCSECRFASDTPFGTAGSIAGAFVAYEVHGSDHRFVNNKVFNYYQGMWVASNYLTDVYDTIIMGNEFRTVVYGVAFFDTTGTGVGGVPATQVYDTLVNDNTFYFADLTTGGPAGGYNFKVAVNITSNTHQRISVQNNRVYKTGTAYPATCCVVGSGVAANIRNTQITIQGNQGFGITFGLYMQASNGTIGSVVHKDNTYFNLTSSTTNVFPSAAVTISNTPAVVVDQLTIGGDTIIWDARLGASLTGYGYNLAGTITDFSLYPFNFTNILTAEYNETGTITKRHTQFLPPTFFSTFASLPTPASTSTGCQAWITDSNTIVFLANAAGAGANKVPLRNNGTNWVVG